MQPGITFTVIAFVAGITCQAGIGVSNDGGSDTANFVLVKEDDGIALYERWYAVSPDLQAREIKATFKVNAQPDAAIALIKDETKALQWNKNTEVFKIISEEEDMWYGYIEYDLPWPVSNQDCVLQYRQNYSGDSFEVTFNDVRHPAFPVQKRIQRIPAISGKWMFTRRGDGIYVEYYVTTTPSSTLPPWLTDPIIRNNLLETLQVFRSILEGNS